MRRPALLLSALALASAACGGGADPTEPRAGAEPATSWVRLSESPLSPRTGATGVWTGEEVLVFGGEQTACPPNASCEAPEEPPLQDGAAYNPATDTWRRITPPLVPVRYAHTAVIGDAVYVWAQSSYAPESWPMFMQYSIRNDTWTSLPQPANAEGQGAPPSVRGMVVTGAGDRLVGYSSSDEQGEQPDWLYDPAAGWSQLPDDPHTPAFDRTMTWAGDRLVLFDKELVANPGSERPLLARAAALDLDTGVWETLPPSETLAYGPWFADNGRLIDPALGSADGGQVNNWGRDYPSGGILDLVAPRWQSLPTSPAGASFSAGALGSQGALYTGYRGVVLDLAAERWLTVPELDEPQGTYGRTIVAAGTDLVVFGGVDWADSGRPRFHNDGWLWAPRERQDRQPEPSENEAVPSLRPEPDPGPVHLWVSASTVPPGAELTAFLVNDGDQPAPTFGVATTVERWVDGKWQEPRFLAVCLDHWHCTGRVRPLDGDEGVPDIGLSATPQGVGPLERFSTEGLTDGVYRVVHRSGGLDAGDGEAFGIFEVRSDAPPVVPLGPAGEPALSLTPGLIGPGAPATLAVFPLIPPPADRGQTAEEIAAAVRDLDEVAEIQQWRDGNWVRLDDTWLSLTSGDLTSAIQRHATIPPLDPGAYRLIRRFPDDRPSLIGNFWVAEAGALRPGTH